jgi:hypothetical protein
MEFLLRAALIGAGATLLIDLWAVALNRLFGVRSLDYALVGRWIGHMPRGRFRHDSIAQAAPVRGEGVIGWTAHYAIGVIFAAILLVTAGADWARQPTLLPALAVGIGSVVAPFFIMQPGLGLGVAGSKTPNPRLARMRSLMTHAVFGIGLYASAVIAAALIGT